MRTEISVIWEMIKKMFGAKTLLYDVDNNQKKLAEYEQKYKDTSKFNLQAVMANSTAYLTSMDNSIDVIDIEKRTSPTPRTLFINNVLQKIKERELIQDEFTFGTGGLFSFPCYYNDGELHFDDVEQSRVVLSNREHAVKSLYFIAGEKKYTNTTNIVKIVNQRIENGDFFQETKAFIEGTKTEIPLSQIEEWSEITPIWKITGVNQLLYAQRVCPKSSRELNNNYGVPLTFGSDSEINKVDVFLEYFYNEYEMKQARLAVDSRTVDGITGELAKFLISYKTINSDKPMFEVFSPNYRQAEIKEGIDYLFNIIEMNSGVTSIITKLDITNATAEAVRRVMYKTQALIKQAHEDKKRYWTKCAYIADEIAESFGITPSVGNIGNYRLMFDFNYSFFEDPQRIFAEKSELQSRGGMPLWKLNQQVTGQSKEEAQADIMESNEENSLFDSMYPPTE